MSPSPPPPPPPPSLEDRLAAAEKELQSCLLRLSLVKGLLADREQEIAALRSSAGDSANLTSSSAQGASTSHNNNSLPRINATLISRPSSRPSSRQWASPPATKISRSRTCREQQQLADRDKELASLRGELSAEMAKLREAERGLIRALRPQIEKGDITVDLNNERLLINLASSYLFGSGQDELNPAGADALKQVGAVLKDFPEYKVAVDGHTDNVAIRGELKKKFPTNQELSESRAANAAKALTEGGLGAATTHGYAETKPVEPNTTASGRAKNRRVEVRVTK